MAAKEASFSAEHDGAGVRSRLFKAGEDDFARLQPRLDRHFSSGHVEVRDTTSDAGRVVARDGQSEGTFLNEPRWRPGESDEILLFYAFGQGVAERDELVIVDGVSGTRRTLPTANYVRSAAWTADGQQIMYASLTELRVRNADGSNDRVVFRPAPASGSDSAFIIGVAAFAPH